VVRDSRGVPHHWTKIPDASAAKPQDQIYEDEETGTVFVLGNEPAKNTKQDIANDYNGVSAGDVTLLKKKR
jgi:hypothetical protein